MITCKELAQQIKDNVKKEIEMLSEWGRPDLAILTNNLPDGERYIRNKIKVAEEVGIKATVYDFMNIPLHNLKSKILDLNEVGIIIQLPYTGSKHLDKILVNHIPLCQDVDGLKGCLTPATAKGVFKYLQANDIINGKNIVVIGRSELVGMPLTKLLLNTDATVTMCHSKTNNLFQHIKNADVIVCAVGVCNFIKPDMLDNTKEYHIVDVGINFDNGKMCGDVSQAVKDMPNVIATPVPGGVGLLTTACLMENAFELFKLRLPSSFE